MCAEPVFVNVSGDQESISASLCAWRAGTLNRVVVPARLAGNRFLSSWHVYKYGIFSLENTLYPGREYCMSYSGPGFLADLAPPPPSPSPVSKFSLFISFPVCRGRGGEEEGREVKSYDCEQAWSSIDRSIFSVPWPALPTINNRKNLLIQNWSGWIWKGLKANNFWT
jgi:hypothetical protein